MTARDIHSRWDSIRQQMQITWHGLTEDELDNVDGNSEKLYGLMQEKYGITREQTNTYLDSLGL